MNTQISFKIDKKLKDEAMKKADEEGVTLSSFLKLSVKAFVEDDLEIGLTHKDKVVSENTMRELKETEEDIKNNKNLSPSFKDAKSAAAYLKKGCK